MRFRRDPGRPLTPGERALAAQVFGAALDCDRIRIHRAKWFPLQPRNVAMAPDGHLWFHPAGWLYQDDFSLARTSLQALFVHELTHAWQYQQGVRLWLRRYPLSRYAYTLTPDRPLQAYGIEQQAMVVEDAFRARLSGTPDGQLEVLISEAFPACSPAQAGVQSRA